MVTQPLIELSSLGNAPPQIQQNDNSVIKKKIVGEMISDAECPTFYIGMTTRNVKKRFDESRENQSRSVLGCQPMTITTIL